MILKLTPTAYRAAKKQGIVRKGFDFLPNFRPRNLKGAVYPTASELEGEYWMRGSIAPCRIEIIK